MLGGGRGQLGFMLSSEGWSSGRAQVPALLVGLMRACAEVIAGSMCRVGRMKKYVAWKAARFLSCPSGEKARPPSLVLASTNSSQLLPPPFTYVNHTNTRGPRYTNTRIYNLLNMRIRLSNAIAYRGIIHKNSNRHPLATQPSTTSPARPSHSSVSSSTRS